VTQTPLSRSKGQRSWSAGRFTHCGVNVSDSIGMYCYFAVCNLQGRSARWHEALRHPQREDRGGSILWQAPAYSLLLLFHWSKEHFVCNVTGQPLVFYWTCQ